MIRALMEIPSINELTCGNCPCREEFFCNLDYAIKGNYKGVDIVYNSRPSNCPLRDINENNYIPFLMHKEMDIPLSECQKAYDLAMKYLRNKAMVKG